MQKSRLFYSKLESSANIYSLGRFQELEPKQGQATSQANQGENEDRKEEAAESAAASAAQNQ